MKWIFVLLSLSACEVGYFPECDYDCGFTGGSDSMVTEGGV